MHIFLFIKSTDFRLPVIFKQASDQITHQNSSCIKRSVPWVSIYKSSVARCFRRPGPISRDINTLRPGQNGRYLADDTFKRFLLNENFRILIKILLKFVPKGPINNNPALVQKMAWRWSGDKPLSEPMMVSLLTHICDTRPQWVRRWYLVNLVLWHSQNYFLHHLRPSGGWYLVLFVIMVFVLAFAW